MFKIQEHQRVDNRLEIRDIYTCAVTIHFKNPDGSWHDTGMTDIDEVHETYDITPRGNDYSISQWRDGYGY